MTTKDQAIAPLQFGGCPSCGKPDCLARQCVQPASAEDMVIYKAIADNYQNSLKPAPDCRTCNWLPECNDGMQLGCTNGDQHEPAPKVVLWRTEL